MPAPPVAHEPAAPTAAPPAAATDGSHDGAAAPKIDGRVARTVRTRAAIIDALLELIEAGDLQPTAHRIAERAGTSIRLIYHHYGDLESLYAAAAKRQVERIIEMTSPIDAGLPLPERLDAFVSQRARVLEFITPVRRAGTLQEPFSAEIRAAREAMQQIAEAEAARVFADVIAAAGADGPTLQAAIATLGAWGFWNDLRTSGRDPDASASAVRFALAAVLGA